MAVTDLDEVEYITELAKAADDAAATVYADWTYAVTTNVLPSQGVGTTITVAYRGDEGKIVSFFRHRDIGSRVFSNSEKLLSAQDEECVGLKFSVARSGEFDIEYSYDIDEAIKWTNQVFSGLDPAELVEILRPRRV